MSEIHYKDQATLQTLVSEEFSAWSDTVQVTQEMINHFAELSGDDMWLHVDVERCASQSPYGCTIAHGFLILSLISRMTGAPGPIGSITGFGHMLNYGSDKLRFLGAVPVDSQVYQRGRVKAIEVSDKKTKVVMETHVHIEGSDTPALVYELMFVYL